MQGIGLWMPAYIIFKSLSHRHQLRLKWKRCKYMSLLCHSSWKISGIRKFPFNLLLYKNLLSNPMTCILILSIRIKAIPFPAYSFNFNCLGLRKWSIQHHHTHTPELQYVCEVPVHLQSSLCLHLEPLQRKVCFVLAGLLHQSTVFTQWKFS